MVWVVSGYVNGARAILHGFQSLVSLKDTAEATYKKLYPQTKRTAKGPNGTRIQLPNNSRSKTKKPSTFQVIFSASESIGFGVTALNMAGIITAPIPIHNTALTAYAVYKSIDQIYHISQKPKPAKSKVKP